MTERHYLTPPPFLLHDHGDGTLSVYRPVIDGDGEEFTLTAQECCAVFWYLRDTRLMPRPPQRP